MRFEILQWYASLIANGQELKKYIDELEAECNLYTKDMVKTTS